MDLFIADSHFYHPKDTPLVDISEVSSCALTSAVLASFFALFPLLNFLTCSWDLDFLLNNED